MLDTVIAIAKDAGKILMKHYRTGVQVSQKTSEFDLKTIADIEADALIRYKLSNAFPGTPILSEESDFPIHNYAGKVFIVDPLDGTKEFIHDGTGFSVIIGLTYDGKPTLGVVYNPFTETLYYGEHGKGSYLGERKLQTSYVQELHEARMVTRIPRGEQRTMDDIVARFPVKERIQESSTGLNIGLVAAGDADFSIATSPQLSKWDTCAPQVLIEEAGGILTDIYGKNLDYTRDMRAWNTLFVASANTALHAKVINALNGLTFAQAH